MFFEFFFFKMYYSKIIIPYLWITLYTRSIYFNITNLVYPEWFSYLRLLKYYQVKFYTKSYKVSTLTPRIVSCKWIYNTIINEISVDVSLYFSTKPKLNWLKEHLWFKTFTEIWFKRLIPSYSLIQPSNYRIIHIYACYYQHCRSMRWICSNLYFNMSFRMKLTNWGEINIISMFFMF